MQDVAIVVAFHSPVDFDLPKRHLQKVLASMVATGAQVVCAQVVMPHQQPQPVPQEVLSRVYTTDSVMFYKENLWNLGADAVDHPYLAFVDADVEFARADWLQQARQSLNNCHILQPFSRALWRAREGGIEENARIASAWSLAQGLDPHPGTHHPGFAWCMTRDAWEAMSGWWDRDPFGGGDTAFAYALAKPQFAERWCNSVSVGASFWKRPTYQHFRSRVQQAGFVVGCIEGDCVHMWHGDRLDRKYMDRDSILPQYRDCEYPLQRGPNKLLHWSDSACNGAVARFFASRREDG